MGIVIRQSFWSTLYSYLGVALGIITSFYLFPHFFTPEQYGLVNLLLAVAGIMLQLAKLGVPNTMLKYFPFYKDNEQLQKQFLGYCLKLMSIGLLAGGLLMVIFKNYIVGFYTEKSGLFVDYYWWLLPLLAGYVVLTYLEFVIRVQVEIVFPTLVREVLLRLFICFFIGLFILIPLSFNVFVSLYIGAYFLCCASLYFFIVNKYGFGISFHGGFATVQEKRDMQRFGLFNVLSDAGWTLTSFIDTIMIGSMSGLAPTAVYRNAFYMATIVQMPQRSVNGIIVPILAQHWKNNRTDEIEKLYKQSSLQLFIMGAFILLLIWCNADSIFSLLPSTYNDNGNAKYFVLLFGLAKIFDMLTSINGEILQTGKHYRYNLYIILGLLLLTIVANYFLIPAYQLMGAAIAAFGVNFLFNLIKYYLVHRLVHIHPFSTRTLAALLPAIICAVVMHYFAFHGNLLLEFFINSSLVCILFVLPVVFFKVSKEINQLLYNLLKRLGIDFKFIIN